MLYVQWIMVFKKLMMFTVSVKKKMPPATYSNNIVVDQMSTGTDWGVPTTLVYTATKGGASQLGTSVKM